MLKIRVKFGKYGSMKFIGHLDVMRYFQKAIRRSEIDICYSAGYSPHPVMSFASPLGLGLTSDGEYMDIQVNSSESSARMIERLNGVMTEEFDIKAWKLLPEDAKTAMSVVAGAAYRVEIRPGHQRPEALFGRLPEVLEEFLSLPQVLMTKKTKKSQVEIDLLPLIFELREDEQVPGAVYMKLAAGSAENLKPELVMEALYRHLGLEAGAFDFLIHRYEMYTKCDGDQGMLIPLADMGADIEA